MESEPVKGNILTINGGSSSIKFALFMAGEPLRRIFKGSIERIGLADAFFKVKGADAAEDFFRPAAAENHTMAVELLMDWIEDRIGSSSLLAVGHRVVHGGAKYYEPYLFSETMINDLKLLTPFAPEHLPQELLLAEAFSKRFPDLRQIACFDTAFHHTLPRVAQLLPIPRKYEAQGVRRYGFHGLSYTFLMRELTRVAGYEAAQGRVILAHLGNGASLAAVYQGKSMDTSMSFTPAAGVPMSTRTGDLDPGLACYLSRAEGMSPAEFNEMINARSGLLGMSETSSDMRDLLEREKNDIRAAEAIAVFCYQVKKWVGGFTAALGGLDTLVFSGGIGENAPQVRSRICAGLDYLGIKIDESANQANAAVISAENSRVPVRIIQTNEEWIIANSVSELLGISSACEEKKNGGE